jgi:hypothetical protein
MLSEKELEQIAQKLTDLPLHELPPAQGAKRFLELFGDLTREDISQLLPIFERKADKCRERLDALIQLANARKKRG